MEIVTKNAEETKAVGRLFANSLVESKKDNITLALVGDLGSGKTTFVQGFAQGLGIGQRIVSPTFIIMRTYRVKTPRKSIKTLYHVDLYRLESNMEKEVTNLGLSDVWGRKGNLVAIEWAEKIQNIMPKDAYRIGFKRVDENTRRINIHL